LGARRFYSAELSGLQELQSVTLACSPERAFEVFTDRMASWWPLDRYSISQERARECAIDPRAGAEVYETRDDGERFPWGRVLVWEPPRRLVMSWHPGREPETAQEVEIRFRRTPEGTLVELEHRDWAKLGQAAAESREGYDGGWAYVFAERFVEACGRAG
jgi:uncharacterized protein YndB with AHSA1/START domain